MITELIHATGMGHPSGAAAYAAALLIFTKQTRLEMDGNGFNRCLNMSEEKREIELAYMAGTIPSSWEFVDLTFLVKGASRACLQQMTRTRTGSYAMQSQRVTDQSGCEVVNPYDPDRQTTLFEIFADGHADANVRYAELLAYGSSKQDARGILPINAESSIVCKYNLRSFVELVMARRSLRTQGEYSEIIDSMYNHCVSIWPWSARFFVPKHAAAIELLEPVARRMMEKEETAKGEGWEIAKAIDLIRKST